MAYFHVIVKVRASDDFISLFDDLTVDDLRAKFLVPYENGTSVFSASSILPVSEISAVKIIETNRDSRTERESIYRRNRESIDEMNRRDDGVYILSGGFGYSPEDIEEAGLDVTSIYIKRGPGTTAAANRPAVEKNGTAEPVRSSTHSRRPDLSPPDTSRSWHWHPGLWTLVGVIGTVVAGGIIYAFGWN